MAKTDMTPATGKTDDIKTTQKTEGSAPTDAPAPPRVGIATKAVLGLVLMFSVFSIGVGVGNGRIHVGNLNRSGQNGSLPAALDYSTVSQVYNVLRQEYDGKLDSGKLINGLKQGLAQAADDPYTEYFTPEKAKQFSDQLNGTGFSGIGAELGQDKDKNLIVVAPIAGTPAAQAGVKPQDIIAEIDGKDTSGLSVEDAVSKIRGKRGTTVELKLIRNKTEVIDLKIIRDDIKIPSVETKMLDDTTGYLRITTFGNDTGSLASQKAQELLGQGAKKIVLDLRGNPGGSVDSAIEVASLWVPKDKLVMQEKRGDQVLKTYTADGNNVLKDLPTVVLINAGSASASEIVSGALKDSGVASLLGEKSYGKGVVQAIEPLGDGGQLKVTIARWYRPNGQNIDKKGIEPDQKVTNSDEDVQAGKDTQLEAAQAKLNQ
jgi:carboxyl-terminal processing protease